MIRCEPCGLSFSPKVYEKHMDRNHAVERCPICDGPILQAVSAPTGAKVTVCSQRCKDEFWTRGLCWVCSKRRRLSPLFCRPCAREITEELSTMDAREDELSAIVRAELVPRRYLRAEAAARVLASRRDLDVA